ncbi:hypothetical protein DAPPUDRAFT_123698 [Daphnia pulex]|uniref:beta-N-acetylhexosaminidase n=1 Tax=Daphnia pulex TaxID=6669 RepID=E9I611_DAPPU|nr:hypothetical protein DAPPUDRAFT_123698 [Daphnia pulex]|eukprot:EFX60569.1 hypothetical protein DAPPUDRAFT_123698 [Daphnia pulex]
MPVQYNQRLPVSCKLTCNDESVLWPKPRDAIYLSKTLVPFLPIDIRINRINAPSSEARGGNARVLQFALVKTIFATAATPASPRSTTSVSITATTFFGARHAIETLSQIMAWDKTLESMIMLTDANISDSPAFVHRGLIIDTSRNFVSVPVIKKIIDAMSYDNSTYSIGI